MGLVYWSPFTSPRIGARLLTSPFAYQSPLNRARFLKSLPSLLGPVYLCSRVSQAQISNLPCWCRICCVDYVILVFFHCIIAVIVAFHDGRKFLLRVYINSLFFDENVISRKEGFAGSSPLIMFRLLLASNSNIILPPSIYFSPASVLSWATRSLP